VIIINKKTRFTTAALAVAAAMSLTVYAAADIRTYKQADTFLSGIGIEAGTLTRGDAKMVYKDIQSDAFQKEATREVLSEKAQELGMKDIPQDAREIYQAIVEYHGLMATAKITSDQIRAIKAGTTFRDIISALGSTKDIGSGLHVLQYAVDGDKILYLSFAREDDPSPLSGEDMLKTLVPAVQDNEDENTFNATLIQRTENSILVSSPTYKNFDVISMHITDATEIVFENGDKATIDDIKDALIITFDGSIMKSYPPQAEAIRIIIKGNK
jgi:hypothetical protein